MSHSNVAVVQILSEVRAQIGEAHSIAKAADLCAKDGQVDRAFEIALDLDGLLHSANYLVQAAAILGRVERREQEKVKD
jgi:hypothetical protein